MAVAQKEASDDRAAREALIRQIQADLVVAQAARADLADAAQNTPEDEARVEAAARELADEMARIEALLQARPE